MKLLLITAVAEFGKEVKQILKKANVKTYSYKEVIGYRNASEEDLGSNWFGTEMNENESIMFYAFVQKENVELVCDAVAEFNSTHSTKIFYTIIGAGELENSLKEQVDLRGLREYVSFKGYQSDARKYLLAFDIFLLPSKKEGLPYALLEAGIAGLPSIASNVGGIPEVIEDKISGLLINSDNHMSITAALEFLLNNPDERNNYAQNLREDMNTHFALFMMIEKTKAVYAL